MKQRLWLLLGFMRPYAGKALRALALNILTTLSSVGLMVTSAWMISAAAIVPSIADLGVGPTGVRFFGIGRAVFRYLERLASHDLTFRLLARIRVWFYERIEPLAPAGLSGLQSGDLLTRIVDDVEELENLYLRVLSPAITAAAVILLTAALFTWFDVWAGLALLLTMSFWAISLPLLAWANNERSGKARIVQRAALNSQIIETLQGLPDLVAFGAAERRLAALDEAQAALIREEHRTAFHESVQAGLGVLALQSSGLIVMLVALPRVEGTLLASLFLGTVAAFEAITALSPAALHWSATIEATRRLFELVESTPHSHTGAGSQVETCKQDDAPDLWIEGLTLRYPGRPEAALEGVSLRVAFGEHIAIVGESGAGKSSLLNALLRFWDYQAGEIRFGRCDLRAINPETLRAQIAVMSQDAHLFNTSLRENIRIGRSEASDEEIAAAVQSAQLDAFITRLPQGLDTLAGEQGVQISGGERQRVALARALLKDAPLLVLDEPGANLDTQTESALLDAVLRLRAGRSLILITHRLVRMEQMDRVLVLHAGRLIEQGSHADLIAAGGYYRRLWDRQGSL